MHSSPPEGKCGASEELGQKSRGSVGTGLRAGLIRGQAASPLRGNPHSPSRVQGFFLPLMLPLWGLPHLGLQVLTVLAPHYHTTSTSHRLPAGEGKGTAGGPHTPPGIRPPPQRPERGRWEWAAGKAGEVGHHTPRGLSHSNSPWGGRKRSGDTVGGQCTAGVQRGLWRCSAQLWKRPWAPEVGERHGGERWRKRQQRQLHRKAETDGERHRDKGNQRRTEGPRDPQRCRATGLPCPAPPPRPLRPPGGAREPRSVPQPAVLGPSRR